VGRFPRGALKHAVIRHRAGVVSADEKYSCCIEGNGRISGLSRAVICPHGSGAPEDNADCGNRTKHVGQVPETAHRVNCVSCN